MTTPRSKISLRPALASDLPEIASLDIAAHPHHPITRLAWSDPSDAYPIFLSRYQLLFSLPYYHFLVATQPASSSLSSSPSSSEEEQEEMVGLVIWKEGGKHEEPEFKPEFPPTANMGLIQYFLGQNIAHQKSLPIEGMAELEVLAVRPGQQRKGIGGLLLGSVLKEVDKRDEKMYVKSSRVGKGLYERFGWKVIGDKREKGFKVELKDYGVEEGYVSWDMVREVGGYR